MSRLTLAARCALAAALALAGAQAQAQAPAPSASAAPASAAPAAAELRALAREAYIATYPLALQYRTMYRQIIGSKSAADAGGLGRWIHFGVPTSDDHDIVTPNVDTPYSYAWVDVRAEPWVLSLPAIEPGRYYTSQWNDLWGHVLDNPGSVVDGPGGGDFLVVAPDWKGDVPKGIKRVIRGDSSILMTLTRTELMGQADMSRVRAIQSQYRLQPLSSYMGRKAPPAAPALAWPAWQEGAEQSAALLRYVPFLLGLTTPHPDDKALLGRLARLGLVPGATWREDALAPEARAAVQAGVADAQAEIRAGAIKPASADRLFGTRADMGQRHLDRTMGVVLGIFGNVAQQVVYHGLRADAQGQAANGEGNAYTLTFAPGALPKAQYFWSVTMYTLPQRYLAANPIARHAIGSRSEGLQFNPDGSLTLLIRKDAPPASQQANWLPAPAGPFVAVLRAYGPDAALLNKTWPVPQLQRVAAPIPSKE